MLTQADVAADMPQMRFEKFYQKLITEIQELEEIIDAKMHPSSYVMGYAGPVGGPSEDSVSLNGWMYLINKAMDKRATLKKQLEFLEGNCEMNWAHLWQRLRNELPAE